LRAAHLLGMSTDTATRKPSAAKLRLTVTCPRCLSGPGRACNIGLYVYRPARRSHAERRAVPSAPSTPTTEGIRQ